MAVPRATPGAVPTTAEVAIAGPAATPTAGPAAIDILTQGRHYLIGVLSLNRTGNAYGLGTEVRKHLPWIRNTTYQLKHEERCVQGRHSFCGSQCIRTEQQCDGIRDCDDGSDEEKCSSTTTTLPVPSILRANTHHVVRGCRIPYGYEHFTMVYCMQCDGTEKAPHGSVFNVTCLEDRGFANPNQTSVRMICFNGEWTPKLEEHKCVELCPGMEYKSLYLTCLYLGNSVPCNETLRPDTKVEVRCKRHYKVRPKINFAYETVCRRDGSIQHVLSECIPECGKTVFSNDELLISNGSKVDYPKYPWHIALYWKIRQSNGSVQYEYQCGGTLIDSNKVLTAAHCIWNVTYSKLIESEVLQVAISKVHRWWDAPDAIAQKRGVAQVIPAEHYNGRDTKYERDIAVLILSSDLKFSDNLMPVCLDLDHSAEGVPVGQRLNVIGWGRQGSTLSFPPSNTLMETMMEYLDLETCRRRFKKYSFDDYLHSDKFCVLYINGSGSQRGDSGGGLTFEHNGLHYIYGVVSIKKEDQNEFAVVTNVTSHRHWLLNILATK